MFLTNFMKDRLLTYGKEAFHHFYRHYSLENYQEALEYLGDMWAVLAYQEKLKHVEIIDNFILRFLKFSYVNDNLGNVHERGARRVNSSLNISNDCLLRDISKKF